MLLIPSDVVKDLADKISNIAKKHTNIDEFAEDVEKALPADVTLQYGYIIGVWAGRTIQHELDLRCLRDA